MSDNKINKAVIDNKLTKYGVTKKTFYSLGSLVICIGLIIILSITDAKFDSNSIKTLSFWVDFTILAGLCIYGMISGHQTGDDMARNNPSGLFRTSLAKFGSTFNKLDSLMLFAYFDEWLEWYRERKLQKKIESILKDNGIHQMDVLDLDLTELDKLTKPYKKEWNNGKNDSYFVSYTLEQIEVIKYCKAGHIKVSKLPRSFFVDAFYHSEKDMWESAAKAGRKKSAYLSVSYIYRIIALLLMSILSAGLTTKGVAGSGQSTVWLSLGKRLFCVSTGFIWGIFVGFELVKIDVSYLDFKTDVLNQYYQECELNVYKPQSLEERAKENYEKMEELNNGEANNRRKEQREENLLE